MAKSYMTLKQNIERENWIETCFGLDFVRKALVPFVISKLKERHTLVLRSAGTNNACQGCHLDTLLLKHSNPSKKQCSLNRRNCLCTSKSSGRKSCPTNFCCSMYNAIIDDHFYGQPEWKNTEMQQWAGDYWAVGKCYININSYKECGSAEEVDCSGLLHIVLNNKYLRSIVDGSGSINDFITMRNIRNEILHSHDMRVDDNRRMDILQHMKNIVTFLNSLDSTYASECGSSLQNLQQLMDHDHSISTQAEVNSLRHNIEILTNENQHIKQHLLDKAIETQNKRLQYLVKKEELIKTIEEEYYRCLTSVSLIPMIKSPTKKVDDVYVDLEMYEGRDSLDDKFERGFNNMENVLYGKGHRHKLIYLLGDAGMGKTTWCKKVINTWLSVRRKIKVENEDDKSWSPDEKVLRHIDVLLHVSLRQHKGSSKVLDMILGQPLFKEYEKHGDTIVNILREEADRCLIVLDGLDEWNHENEDIFPEPDQLHGATVIVTTRPYRKLTLACKNESSKIDKIVKIMGVENVQVLAERVIEQLKSYFPKQEQCSEEDFTFQEFRKKVDDLPDFDVTKSEKGSFMQNFLKNPLMLTLMVCLWYDGNVLCNTATHVIGSMIDWMIRYAETYSALSSREHSRFDMSKLKSNWRESQTCLPESLRSMVNFRDYAGLIVKLSRLADSTLTCF
ncbi:uncharacterized protein LOC128216524 [Mya arenaria]|uniref:uncharacterized protein LOC128216524 n=1 Tax=Mya arenaria TaxID=6604 RepID=UPI0022DEA823|nr:uncharacterized protein LOC128216524 [Mya arenaria]